MLDSTYDPYLVSLFHEEYLTLINTFRDLKRPGAFIRYYNINFQQSVVRQDINSSFDNFNINGIYYDIYELTPCYNISPIVSSSGFVSDKKGNMFEGVTTITTYTISEPHPNDLIVFYDPIKSGEIFKINNLRTAINAVYSEPAVTWYEMDLEVAPIKDVSGLKIFKHYIYDIPKEKYYDYIDYSKKLALIETISSKTDLINNFYSKVMDLYIVDNTYIPMICNQVALYFKNKTLSNNNFLRIFNSFKKPYGFISRFSDFVDDEINFNALTFKVYNIQTDLFEDYIWNSSEVNNLNTLLQLSKDIYVDINNELFT